MHHFVLALLVVLLSATPALAQPAFVLDLLDVTPADNTFRRIYGARGTGQFGVPVAGGHDVDGDGIADVAVAYFTVGGETLGDDSRPLAGEVDLLFGAGTLGGERDTALDGPDLLRIVGAGERETAGNEIWIDDVTGDGLGDLLIGRQNFAPPPGASETGRIGAGALTVIPGGPDLRRLAAQGVVVDLAAPPPGLEVLTLVGRDEIDRLGIWMRTGDIDGDGIADLVVGADQEDFPQPGGVEARNRGALYVLRGGSHLATRATVDLADFGTPAFDATPLAGRLARVVPPLGELFLHLGATCQIADLDGDGRGEVLAAATINRSGASISAAGAPLTSAEASAGVPGALFILWADNFPAASNGAWPAGFTLDLTSLPGSRTVIRGGTLNNNFGEEIIGGADLDADGRADLFVGDLLGRHPTTAVRVGLGDVFFDAARLRGFDGSVEALPPGVRHTRIAGPNAGSIGADTAAIADFDADGIADLAFASPHADVRGRVRAGTVHVIYGRDGGWPAFIDTAPGALPPSATVRVTLIEGARGSAAGGDGGDTLAYSATAADLDGDGHGDLIVNEMQGNGLAPGSVDAGNLLLLSGASLTGDCVRDERTLCLQDGRFALRAAWQNAAGVRGAARRVLTDAPDSGLLWFFERDNWEVLVKVLDGCGVNDHFWVFTAATTDVGYTIFVTDTATGVRREYVNPLGTAADAVTDTGAFTNCP